MLMSLNSREIACRVIIEAANRVQETGTEKKSDGERQMAVKGMKCFVNKKKFQ